MNLTAYEMGVRSPADYFPPEERMAVIRREQKPKQKGPSPAERERRQQLAFRVREHFPTTEAMGRAVGTHGGNISKWFNGQRPVPDKYVPALERIARTGS